MNGRIIKSRTAAKRTLVYAFWVLLSCLLYFFENNTGTRILFCCALLGPLLPALRRVLFSPPPESSRHGALSRPAPDVRPLAGEEPGDVRPYLPGDPVNRIHWKLSAKKEELLVRAPVPGEEVQSQAERQIPAQESAPAPAAAKKKPVFWCIPLPVLLSALLLLLPSARQGAQALLNRLFAASEAVNAYAYARFPVPADAPVGLAFCLIILLLLSLAVLALLSGSLSFWLFLLAGCALFQCYFGLSFPAWINVPLFLSFPGLLLWQSENRRQLFCLLALAAAAVLAVCLAFPGVHSATEAASEAVRDRLSRLVSSFSGAFSELPPGQNETRHVHTQTLLPGDQEAAPSRQYRLVTLSERQISMPHWVDYLRILLLPLLSAALLILPFLPFFLLNQRRRKALLARQAFASADVSQAIAAIFQHTVFWLDATGHGEGNLPYARWSVHLSDGYALRFARCAKLFEEAVYSGHPMTEAQRRQVLSLLEETERVLKSGAGWKQRLRLKYRECLWI